MDQELINLSGGELQGLVYFCLGRAIIKPQYIDHIPKVVQGNVAQVLVQKDEKHMKAELCDQLENVGDLSGGELQWFAIAVVAIQSAEIYMFDEPSSYLDVKLHKLFGHCFGLTGIYVIVVEHDLSVLDYLSDFICCLYGKPGAYGAVTLPFSDLFRTENLRFRDDSFTFKVAETAQESAKEIQTYVRYKFPTMTKAQGSFKFCVVEGEFTDSQIIVMPGVGRGWDWKDHIYHVYMDCPLSVTFCRGLLKSDSVKGSELGIPEFNVSYKPQKISPKFQSTVRQSKIPICIPNLCQMS
ncbi:ABC transporter E family member 2 [Nymphaea thermarum]|nr:ABC transporter E family member 2 [Nymphaea thermarum]